MSIDLSQVQYLISSNPDLSDTGEAQSEVAVTAAEDALYVDLPESYRAYLKRWGWISFGPHEYMGLGLPFQDVVIFTNRLRENQFLPQSLVVVASHEGG